VQPPQLPGRPATTTCTANAAAMPRADALAQAERRVLHEVLESCGWNVSMAATQLHISRRTLHRKLKAHGMRRYSAWNADQS